MALLVAQGTDLLGTQDSGDYFWRSEDAYFQRANFEALFRSIGLTDNTEKLTIDSSSVSILEAAMDVLAMTQPYNVCLAPSPEQLRPAAQKLLEEGSFQSRYRTARKDLSNLLSLLFRVSLRRDKWGSYFHFGSIGACDPSDLELADILVEGLAGNQDVEYLTSAQTITATDLLVSLSFVAQGPLQCYAGHCLL